MSLMIVSPLHVPYWCSHRVTRRFLRSQTIRLRSSLSTTTSVGRCNWWTTISATAKKRGQSIRLADKIWWCSEWRNNSSIQWFHPRLLLIRLTFIEGCHKIWWEIDGIQSNLMVWDRSFQRYYAMYRQAALVICSPRKTTVTQWKYEKREILMLL